MMISHLTCFTLFFFFILFSFRHAFLQRNKYIITFHCFLFFTLFIASIGGGGVQNAAYDRLKIFLALEKEHKLEEARNNLQAYDSTLAIDLKQFKDSKKFKAYLKKHDGFIDKAESIFIAWLFVFISDIALLLICLFRYREQKKQGF